MNRPTSGAIEKIISVAVAVVFLSAFSAVTQNSSAEEIAKIKEQEVKTQADIEAEIEKQRQKIAKLQLQKFSVQKTAFTDVELAQMLAAVGFEGKALRTAWAVVKKESNGRPLAFNGNTRTGDSSYGIFQINMIGGLGVTRRDKYDLDSNKDLFDAVINAQIAYHMSNGGEDWTSWKISAPYTNSDEIRFRQWYEKFPEGVIG
jgi:diaminopimelate decarboxylase